MFWVKLTCFGLALAWIYCVNGASSGINNGHDFGVYNHDPNFRDFHYERPPPPPPRRDPFHNPPRRDPPPPPPRGDRPPPPPRRPKPMPPRDDDLQVLYMEDHCRLHIRKYVLDDARVYVDDSMHVELTKEPELQRQFSCLVTFSTRDPDYKLLLHFEQVDINYNPGTVDRFRIYDGVDARKELTPARGLYGKYSKNNYEFSSGSIRDYRSTGPALTLYFIGSPSEVFGGFELLLTVFKDENGRGKCDPGYLKCEVNNICVSESLLCNGAQNCGQSDHSDFRDCAPRDHGRHGGGNPNGMFQGPTDIGLMVGCALSIVILMVVVIWLGVICMKKKGLDRMRRHYARQEDSSDTAVPQDGSIVEPAQIHRVITPAVNFMEPPPLYSENDVPPTGSASDLGYSSGRFELPPPYSPMDDRDTAGLIRNESDESNLPTVPSYSQSMAGVHRQVANESRAPTPPIRTSSIPQEISNNNNDGNLRQRRMSGAQSGLRPLTGITRQQSKDEEAGAITPGTPKILNEEDSGFRNAHSRVLSVPSIEAVVATETNATEQQNVDNSLQCSDTGVSVA